MIISAVAAFPGVGGGFLLVPFLTSVAELPMYLAAGTSALAVLISMITSIVTLISKGVQFDWMLIGLELVGVAVGSVIGPADLEILLRYLAQASVHRAGALRRYRLCLERIFQYQDVRLIYPSSAGGSGPITRSRSKTWSSLLSCLLFDPWFIAPFRWLPRHGRVFLGIVLLALQCVYPGRPHGHRGGLSESRISANHPGKDGYGTTISPSRP